MEIKFNKPKIESTFQAEIYRALFNGNEEYRVIIGLYGTECPRKIGSFLDYYSISDFMNRKGIESWIDKQARELKTKGKKIKFDKNRGYLMAKAIEELANETRRN